MSATNRGAVRHELDHYETPFEAVAPIAHMLPRVACIVDAGCGSGAIGRHLSKLGALHGACLIGIDAKDRGAAEPYTTSSSGHASTSSRRGSPISLSWPTRRSAARANSSCGAKWKHRESVPIGAEPVAHPSLLGAANDDACEHFGHHLIDKVSKSTSDATAYAWFCWRPGPVGRVGVV